MSRHRPPRLAPPQGGFGLIELMVAITLTGAVMIVLFLTFFRSRDELGRISTLVDSRQSARATVQLLERDIRMAGSCFAKMPLNASANGIDTTWYAINPGPGSGDNDSLRLVGAWSASSKITVAVPSATDNITIQSLGTGTNAFAVNDLILLTNGTVGHLFQITGINSLTKTLIHANTSPWNVVPSASSWNWPPGGGYSVGSQVYKIDIVSYSIDSTSYRRPTLVRRPFNGAPQVVSYNVNKLQIWYRMEDGTLTRSPALTGASAAVVDKVRPMVFTSLGDPTRPTYVDSMWSEVRPRTF
jgi:type II secretory pathway pseudopilin PulG